MSVGRLGASSLVGAAVREYGRMLPWVTLGAAVAVAVPEELDRAIGRLHLRGTGADLAVVASWLALSALQLTAASAHALARCRGGRPRHPDTFRTAARRLVPAAVAATLGLAAVLAGSALLVAPGLAALGAVAVAPAVVIEERLGPLRAVGRSLELTRGHRAVVAGASVLLLLVTAVLLLTSWIVVAGLGVRGGDGPALSALFTFMLFAPLPPVGAAVAYAALRDAKEAPREEELVRVFG